MNRFCDSGPNQQRQPNTTSNPIDSPQDPSSTQFRSLNSCMDWIGRNSNQKQSTLPEQNQQTFWYSLYTSYLELQRFQGIVNKKDFLQVWNGTQDAGPFIGTIKVGPFHRGTVSARNTPYNISLNLKAFFKTMLWIQCASFFLKEITPIFL